MATVFQDCPDTYAGSTSVAIQDAAVIGCSDSLMARYVGPPLTTIHLPFRRMGEHAAERLIFALAGTFTSGLSTMPFHLETHRPIAPPNQRSTRTIPAKDKP